MVNSAYPHPSSSCYDDLLSCRAKSKDRISKQIMPFGFEEQHTIKLSQFINLQIYFSPTYNLLSYLRCGDLTDSSVRLLKVHYTIEGFIDHSK